MILYLSNLAVIGLVVAALAATIGCCAAFAKDRNIVGSIAGLAGFTLLLIIGNLGVTNGNSLLVGFAVIYGFFWVIFGCAAIGDGKQASATSH